MSTVRNEPVNLFHNMSRRAHNLNLAARQNCTLSNVWNCVCTVEATQLFKSKLFGARPHQPQSGSRQEMSDLFGRGVTEGL
jgi:hypothetical protein